MGNPIEVSKLQLEGKCIGYRVSITKSNRKIVRFDMEETMLLTFLRLLKTTKYDIGKVINGKLVDGKFVTTDERDVFEVDSIATAKRLLDKHYFWDLKNNNGNAYKYKGIIPIKVSGIKL